MSFLYSAAIWEVCDVAAFFAEGPSLHAQFFKKRFECGNSASVCLVLEYEIWNTPIESVLVFFFFFLTGQHPHKFQDHRRWVTTTQPSFTICNHSCSMSGFPHTLSFASQTSRRTGRCRWSFPAASRWVSPARRMTGSTSTARGPTSCTWKPATLAWWNKRMRPVGLSSCVWTAAKRHSSHSTWPHLQPSARGSTASPTSRRRSRPVCICMHQTSSRWRIWP